MNKEPADAALFEDLHQQYDLMASRIDSVQLWLSQGAEGPLVGSSIETNESAQIQPANEEMVESSVTDESVADSTNVVQLHRKPEPQESVSFSNT